MASTTSPLSSITLRGVRDDSSDDSQQSTPAILLKLNTGISNELKKAEQSKEGIHFTSGSTPQLRIGKRTIDLSLSPEDFRNELFSSSTAGTANDLTFSRLITHRGQAKNEKHRAEGDTAGIDAGLAALQSSLASIEQEKQSRQVNITNSILPAPKSRFDAARREKMVKKRPGLNTASQPSSPPLSAVGTPRLGAAPTSVPASEDAAKQKAMKTAVVHLLAMKSLNTEDIVKQSKIPRPDLEDLLRRIGKQSDGKWQLGDRAYKDLDAWKFEYSSQADRQAAIDNAVKAFDRMRLGKDDSLWQTLLPKKDRGKGIVLSKLQLGGGQANKTLTPHYQPSPMPHLDGTGDSKLASGANTPRLGGSTPRPGSSKGDVMKRLLSKDPKKARAAEEAKEKKRKEREAAVSDREGGKPAKKPATKKPTPNVKSAEFVHSSEDESDNDGEIGVDKTSEPQPTKEKAKAAAKSASTAVTSSSESDKPIKERVNPGNPVSNPKTAEKAGSAKKSPASHKAKTTDEKTTPQKTANNNLSAPNTQHKDQRSPGINNRPSIPSPLGAARPRVASDVSDRSAFGQKARQGTETPRGLGITNGSRKRQDTTTSMESLASSRTADANTQRALPAEQQKRVANGSLASTNVLPEKTNNANKRKANDDTSSQPPNKHQKTDSGSSQSHRSRAGSNGQLNGTAQTSPEGVFGNTSSSDSSGSVMDTITYNQGVNLAEKFLNTWYPAYTKLYDDLEARQARGETIPAEDRDRLWAMHKRLEQRKREIGVAATREHSEE